MVTYSFLLHVKVSETKIEEMKNNAVIKKRLDLETAALLKFTQQFVFKVKNEVKNARFNVSTVSYRK